MKKFILILIIILAVILTIPHKNSKSDELVFWTLQMNDFAPYMNKVISQFETENPEIKIKWIDVPFSEGEKRTLASVLSDNPPDLINLNPDFTALLAQRGALYEIAPEYTTQFNKSIINSLKYNGKLYSLPWYATSAITIYNKDLLKGNKVPSTYDEMAEIAPKLEAYATLPNITENDTMLRILNKYGVTAENINSEQSIAVFELFKNMYEKGYIPKESITQTHREALEKYMAEQIVFFQAGANFLNMIKENAPSTYSKTDVAPQLTGKLGQNDFSLMNFVIPSRAKYKKEALDFCLYLTNEQNQLELAQMTNIIATNSSALKSSFYNDNSTLEAKARSISAKQINRITPQLRQRRNQKEINTQVNAAVQSALLNKDSIENILEKLSKTLEGIEE